MKEMIDSKNVYTVINNCLLTKQQLLSRVLAGIASECGENAAPLNLEISQDILCVISGDLAYTIAELFHSLSA